MRSLICSPLRGLDQPLYGLRYENRPDCYCRTGFGRLQPGSHGRRGAWRCVRQRSHGAQSILCAPATDDVLDQPRRAIHFRQLLARDSDARHSAASTTTKHARQRPTSAERAKAGPYQRAKQLPRKGVLRSGLLRPRLPLLVLQPRI